MRMGDGDSSRPVGRQHTQERATIMQVAKGVKPVGVASARRRGPFSDEDGKALAKSVRKQFKGGLPHF